MLCPECNHPLQPATLKTKINEVVLDYCAHCGGVWSDSGEINVLGEKDLGPLEHLLPKNPTHQGVQNHLCPRDRATLEIFRGESVPQTLTLFHCKSCWGMFFPSHSLSAYKKAQVAKIDYFKLWNIPLHSVYAIALPLLIIAILGTGLFAALYSVDQKTDIRSRADEMISEPLVLSPSSTQVMINFTTKTPSVTKIKYWVRGDEVTELWMSSTPSQNHTIVLKNVSPHETYSYQILTVEPEVIESPVYSFSAEE